MALINISLTFNDINSSIQVGDTIYYSLANAASGGFIPTENYTEVQDMISNKAKKSSNLNNQMTQNFYHGGSVHDSYSVADVLAAPSLPSSYLTTTRFCSWYT